MKKTITMPSGNGKGELKLDLVLDEELGDKCGLYAKVTIPAGSTLGYHEHHGEGESYFILSGEAVYDDNGTKRRRSAGSPLATRLGRLLAPATAWTTLPAPKTSSSWP